MKTTHTEAQHTSTPYHLSGEAIINIRGQQVATIYTRLSGDDVADENAGNPMDSDTVEANATFIVRACNSHDALVGACDVAEKNLTGLWRSLYKEQEPSETSSLGMLLSQLRAALQLAQA